MMQSGQHLQTWDGTDNEGTKLSAGVYTCRVKAGDFTGGLKMILMR
jgi:flagellar hook assembly protein FlgD